MMSTISKFISYLFIPIQLILLISMFILSTCTTVPNIPTVNRIDEILANGSLDDKDGDTKEQKEQKKQIKQALLEAKKDIIKKEEEKQDAVEELQTVNTWANIGKGVLILVAFIVGISIFLFIKKLIL